MHDVTEGGIFGAVSEICFSSGFGAKLFVDKIPLHPVTKKICEISGDDPYRLISSGSMLFATSEPDLAVSALEQEGIKAAVIGVVTEEKSVKAMFDDKEESIFVF